MKFDIRPVAAVGVVQVTLPPSPVVVAVPLLAVPLWATVVPLLAVPLLEVEPLAVDPVADVADPDEPEAVLPDVPSPVVAPVADCDPLPLPLLVEPEDEPLDAEPLPLEAQAAARLTKMPGMKQKRAFRISVFISALTFRRLSKS
jgi:hypothetical protein